MLFGKEGTYSVDPFRIEKRLVDVRRPIVPLTVHIEVVAPNHRSGKPRDGKHVGLGELTLATECFHQLLPPYV